MASNKGLKGKISNLIQNAELGAGAKLKHESFKTKNGNRDRRLNHGYEAANRKEDSLIDAIDLRRQIDKLVPIFEKIDQGKLDVQGLFQGVSSEIAKKLIYIAMCGESEKNRLDASKHLLALAGHNPAQKHEISRIDPSTPKEALLALIAGTARELENEGVEVVDDRSDKE